MSGKEYALKRVKRKEMNEHNSDLGEVLLLLACEHENIIRLLGYDLKVSQESHCTMYSLYMLMDLGEPTLAQEIQSRQENKQLFTQYEFFKVISQLVEVYAFLQEKKSVAHRDVKPQNMLFNKHTCAIQICDFNDCFSPQTIPSSNSSTPLLSSQLVGTPYYMAPELKTHFNRQQKNKLLYDPFKSDVYSLGLSLLDIVELSLQTSSLSIEDRLELVKFYHGDNFYSLLNIMLQPSPIDRYDFLQILTSQEYIRLQDEMADQIQLIDNIAFQSSYCHSIYQCSDIETWQATSNYQSETEQEQNESIQEHNHKNNINKTESALFINDQIQKISNLTEKMIALYNHQVNPSEDHFDPHYYYDTLHNILNTVSTLTNELQINQQQSQIIEFQPDEQEISLQSIFHVHKDSQNSNSNDEFKNLAQLSQENNNLKEIVQ